MNGRSFSIPLPGISFAGALTMCLLTPHLWTNSLRGQELNAPNRLAPIARSAPIGEGLDSATVGAENVPDDDFAATGELRAFRRTRDGGIRYGVVDEYGTITAHVTPIAGMSVREYLGKQVGVMARSMTYREGKTPHIQAEAFTLLGGDPVGDIQLASHLALEGPIAPVEFAGEVVTETLPSGAIAVESGSPPIRDNWSGGGPVYGGSCGVSCGGTCGGVGRCSMGQSCGLAGWYWVRPEYVAFWTSGMNTPPLVTTSPNGTPQSQAGVLNQTGTTILYGNEGLMTKGRDGFRIRFGGWWDACQRYGWEGEYFGFGYDDEYFQASSDFGGNPILARPFFNMNPREDGDGDLDPPARDDSELVAYPDELAGTVTVFTESKMDAGGFRLRRNLCSNSKCVPRCDGCGGVGFHSRFDVTTGYRFYQLSDRLLITEELTSLSPDNPGSFDIFDAFRTRNQFHGWEVGSVWEMGWDRLSLEFLTRVALGNVRQTVEIDGGTTIFPAIGAPEEFSGGLLALDSNIGGYKGDEFTAIPELGTTLGWQVTPRLRCTLGYTLIYWGNVVRPGDQIDLDINPDQIPEAINPVVGPARPAFAFRHTDFWVQGLNLGLDYRW